MANPEIAGDKILQRVRCHDNAHRPDADCRAIKHSGTVGRDTVGRPRVANMTGTLTRPIVGPIGSA